MRRKDYLLGFPQCNIKSGKPYGKTHYPKWHPGDSQMSMRSTVQSHELPDQCGKITNVPEYPKFLNCWEHQGTIKGIRVGTKRMQTV